MMNLQSSIRGSLIGCALGDAVGFLVEKQQPESCIQYIRDQYMTGKITEFTRQYKNNPPIVFGSYSDDTQLTRELMISLIIKNGWNPEDYAMRIAKIFKTNAITGAGNSTRLAATKLINGVHWSESGTPSPAAGNGTAMRASPIGLFYQTDYESIIRASKEQSVMTHSDPRCLSGSVLISLAAALALEDINTKEEFLDKLLSIAAENDALDSETYKALLILDNILDSPLEEAIQVVAALDTERDPVFWNHIAPYVTTTVIWSLWCFLNNMNDYETAMISAIVVGGDVDSTAAITGALSGARVGIEAIPTRYFQYLNDKGRCRYHDLIKIADAFHSKIRI